MTTKHQSVRVEEELFKELKRKLLEDEVSYQTFALQTIKDYVNGKYELEVQKNERYK